MVAPQVAAMPGQGLLFVRDEFCSRLRTATERRYANFLVKRGIILIGPKPPMDASTETNPYKAPGVENVAAVNPSGADAPFYFRDGKLLVIRDGAELPKRCVHTNQEVDEKGWRKRKPLAWTPPWVFVFIFFGLLPFLLLSVLLQKRAKVTYSLSKDARGRLAKKRLIALGVMLAGIGVAVGGGSLLDGDAAVLPIFGGVVIALGGLIGSLMFNPVAVRKYKDGWFSLKGCSPGFLDSI